MKDDLGDRMKRYEKVTNTKLVRRMPVIIRIDGKAFHSFTKYMDKPFDKRMQESMEATMLYLCQNVQNAKFAYTQSDEISILMTDYATHNTEPWFDNTVQKIASVAASMATAKFNNEMTDVDDCLETTMAMFDCRVFNLPKEEVVNYFIWRQNDAIRNSVSMYGQTNFSHKELHGINTKELVEKLYEEANVEWCDEPSYNKRGSCCIKKTRMGRRPAWEITEIPVLRDDREFIGDLL